MAANLKNVLDRGIAAASVKSANFLETSKLSNQIRVLQESIGKSKLDMASEIYLAWQQSQPIEEFVACRCAEIQASEAQIVECQQKIEQLKEEGRKVLGEPAPTSDAAAGASRFCSACGASNAMTAKFCYKCGGKL